VAALLRFAFKQKNMQGHIFPFESELQNNSQEAAPSSPSFSVSEKLALYGSSALLRITERVAAAARILQINFLDHVIVGQGYFSFQEAGLL